MSTELAIAGVTAVLRDMLNDGLINGNVSGVLGQTITVTALPPDQVVSGSGAETSQLNLFLHKVTPNTGWCNNGLPSRDSSGQIQLNNPPLALNLHYLLSAYTNAELHGEILLGYAMRLLHETPVLSRAAIRVALNPSLDTDTSLPPALQALSKAGLDQQVEQIRITPEYLNTEELSKLWTAMQARYRTSSGYQVSVVLIQGTRPTSTALPVLSRGKVDPVTRREAGVALQPNLLSSTPQVDSLVLPNAQTVAQLGDNLGLIGQNLDGTQQALLLTNTRLSVSNTINTIATPTGTPASAVNFTLPDDPVNYPAGIYSAQLQLTRSSDGAVVLSNAFPLTIAPRLLTPPTSAQLDSSGKLTLLLNCTPQLRPRQRVSLILGRYEALAEDFDQPTTTPTFVFDALPPSPADTPYRARLRVDGIDSIIIDRSVTPPAFTGPQIQVKS